MPVFTTILCPIEFDDNSLAALDLAIKEAQQNTAKVYLMHTVVIVAPMGVPGAPVEPYPDIPIADVRARLEQLGHERLEGKAPYEIIIDTGDPATEILREAKEHGADLIVMATHGREGLSHLFLGSVTERVIRESMEPVLVVRPHH